MADEDASDKLKRKGMMRSGEDPLDRDMSKKRSIKVDDSEALVKQPKHEKVETPKDRPKPEKKRKKKRSSKKKEAKAEPEGTWLPPTHYPPWHEPPRRTVEPPYGDHRSRDEYIDQRESKRHRHRDEDESVVAGSVVSLIMGLLSLTMMLGYIVSMLISFAALPWTSGASVVCMCLTACPYLISAITGLIGVSFGTSSMSVISAHPARKGSLAAIMGTLCSAFSLLLAVAVLIIFIIICIVLALVVFIIGIVVLLTGG